MVEIVEANTGLLQMLAQIEQMQKTKPTLVGALINTLFQNTKVYQIMKRIQELQDPSKPLNPKTITEIEQVRHEPLKPITYEQELEHKREFDEVKIAALQEAEQERQRSRWNLLDRLRKKDE